MSSLVKSLTDSITSITALLLLLSLSVFIAALLGIQLFSGKFPSSSRSNFDGMVASTLTVFQVTIQLNIQPFSSSFQILTGEDWHLIMFDGIAAAGGITGWGSIASLYFVLLFICGLYFALPQLLDFPFQVDTSFSMCFLPLPLTTFPILAPRLTHRSQVWTKNQKAKVKVRERRWWGLR